ncbi:MAG TPA: RDD family protein [Candidatus Acidoferrales bacterium]|nr:RDD family protein [Candidatus Acidoferrales bacterium]
MSLSRRVTTITDGNLAVNPEWRREVSSRLQDYRARRRSGSAPDLQTALPFDSVPPDVVEPSVATEEPPPPPPRKSNSQRLSRSERFEIAIPKSESPQKSSRASGLAASDASAISSHEPLRNVASLPERRRAAIVDAGLLFFSYGGMLALFAVLGGRIGLNKVDLLVAGATFALFYTQYFALFTVFGGATPGMMLRGLRVVGFDGGVPTSQQMAWRSAGYLISASVCCLGFVWSLWDDDQVCWHDRISQTYLTPIEENRRY